MPMRGHIINLEQETLANTNFRKVLYTAKHVQLVAMSLNPGEDIGEEVHELDQFLRVEAGTGQAVLNGVTHDLADGSSVLVPAGVMHNIINTSQTDPLKLYTLYAPPEHKDGVVFATKAEAMAAEEHFDGIASEA